MKLPQKQEDIPSLEVLLELSYQERTELSRKAERKTQALKLALTHGISSASRVKFQTDLTDSHYEKDPLFHAQSVKEDIEAFLETKVKLQSAIEVRLNESRNKFIESEKSVMSAMAGLSLEDLETCWSGYLRAREEVNGWEDLLGLELSGHDVEQPQQWVERVRNDPRAREKTARELIIKFGCCQGGADGEREMEKLLATEVIALASASSGRWQAMFQLGREKTMYRIPLILLNKGAGFLEVTATLSTQNMSEKEIETTAILFSGGGYSSLNAAAQAAKLIES